MAARIAVLLVCLACPICAICVTAERALAAPAGKPIRPLPVASDRPMASGPAYHVDPVNGETAGDGSAKRPWRTIGAAIQRLKPGDTLYLHGGVYFESVTMSGVTGSAKAPITIRAMPGELAILDGGVREFVEAPATAWEAVKGGAPGEFRSLAEFNGLARSRGDDEVRVLGNFADTMIPLHGYRFAADLRANNPYWNVPEKATAGAGIYVGPGVWLDPATHRIHVRLATLRPEGQASGYAGETDPRKVALVIGVDRSALRIENAAHVRVQDLVFRGSAARTVEIIDASHIELDGVTIYGGTPALHVSSTHDLRMVRSALRGTAAPWSSRSSMKYRSNAPYLLVAGSQGAQSRDWELAYNEFTDGHDGLVLDSLKGLRFHHNRIDNFNDDGIVLGLHSRTWVPSGVEIYENLISRVLMVLAFHDGGRGKQHGNPIGSGLYVYRNVFDLREGTYDAIPGDAQAPAQIRPSRLCGDHGSPIWEPIMFYHNTVIHGSPVFRDYYGGQMVMGTAGTRRRLFNNIFVQVEGNPGLNVPGPDDDVQADGNLMWGLRTGPGFDGDFFAARASRRLPAGFGAHDRFADPRLARLVDGDPALDVRPVGGSGSRGEAGTSVGGGSPGSRGERSGEGGVVDAGVKIPADWPDSLRALDHGKPDIGALPLGAAMLRVGPAAAPRR